MPLFKQRKVPKDESRKLVERSMVLARESPEPTFDLSKCGITEVPSGVFSLCKVLLKEALLLYDNELTSLKEGGTLRDLTNMRVLDLHNNSFTSLPHEIGLLAKLQILNLQNNKLKYLPKTIGDLSHLQTLNLQGNELQTLPDEIGKLKSLRTLNISQNKLKAINIALAHVRTLENLIVDVDKLAFPPKDVTAGGTAVIMKHLCKSAGIEYIPPSQHLLPVLDPSTVANGQAGKICAVDDLLAATLSAHEREKELRKQQMLQLERQMQDVEEQQKMLTEMASRQRQELMQKIRKTEEEMDDQVLWQQQKLEMERQKKLSALAADEQLANDTVAVILQINERAKNTEMIMDELERERIRTEQLVQVTQEEQDRLKREEVLASMARMLESRANQERLIREYEALKDQAREEAVQRSVEADQKVLCILNNQHDDRMSLMKDISNEEQAQIEALQALQLQKDAKHKRISNQIAMLQDELSTLSIVELGKREERLEAEQIVLEAKREGLTQLLTQLLDEQQARELELMKRLLEMEEQRESDIKDYWLIQYQRLLDSKPQSLLEKECDATVMKVLNEAGAVDHAALFARHKITWDTMETLTDSDLKEMGVREVGIRKSILNVIQDRQEMNEKAKSKQKAIESELQRPTEQVVPQPSPSAPPVLERAASISNTAECVVCMDRGSDVVLLPCGHVCCCIMCSASLTSCPMCRQPITQRIRMFVA